MGFYDLELSYIQNESLEIVPMETNTTIELSDDDHGDDGNKMPPPTFVPPPPPPAKVVKEKKAPAERTTRSTRSKQTKRTKVSRATGLLKSHHFLYRLTILEFML